MKPSIPPAVWEKKRSQIAKLYKDEEWPLKQVIKQIRTEEFNPSETQLRSRLKKWRVTKPSRQCRKKAQDSPPYRAATDVEGPFRSATTTPPSSVDDAPIAASTLPKTQSASPPSDVNWCNYSGWYPASEYRQPYEPCKKTMGEQHTAPPWAFSTVHSSPNHNSCNNAEPYRYRNIQTIPPIHTYPPPHSANSPISRTPVDGSPPLHSPFTESGFPELCFSTLPPPEYEWSVQLRDDIHRTDLATTSGYTSPIEAIAPSSKPTACTQEPPSISMTEYANHIHAPLYTEAPSFLDDLSSIESLPEIGSWRRPVSGSLDSGVVEGAVRVDQSKRMRKSREGLKE